MSSRKEIVRVMALWGQACPIKDSGESREARLHYITAVIGHPVASANDLSANELDQVIRSLNKDLSSRGTPGREREQAGSSGKSSNLRQFPNRTRITKRQLWKIRQIEIWLGWQTNPARLAGYLDAKFKTRRPEHLTHAQAWRAIEALMAVAARERVKAAHGPEYKVGNKELGAERDRLKKELESWRPPELANMQRTWKAGY